MKAYEAMKQALDAEFLRAWIVNYISSVLDMDKETFPTSEPFDSYGFDSAEAVIMAGVMEEEFDVEIDPSLFFEEPSVDGLISALRAAGLAA
ncbi:acyl carrier protein [Rhizobiales bacterium L72]|uniref:Acyl carrier protein n=2 Tax=Propylenella binzhouense TaxID=2555902 RepID=A0A964T2W6_9HYPH|nr:acyl carrier protein [Propylenella binzhouense]